MTESSDPLSSGRKPRFVFETFVPRLETDDFARLSPLGSTVRLREGEPLFRAGEIGLTMYVVTEGEIELQFSYDRPSKILGVGSFFGELALLSGLHRRSATALARTQVRLIELGPEDVDKLLEKEPAFLARLLRQSCRYLLESEYALLSGLETHMSELDRALSWLRRTKEERDVAELQARTDPLTGLFNRRYLDERVAELIRPGADVRDIALVLVDADHFKEINDRFSHSAGDRVLRHFGRILREHVRSHDLPVRVGGDELAVLFVGIRAQDAESRARQLSTSLRSFEVELPEGNVSVGASVGGASLRSDESFQELFSRADAALYRVKQAGGGRFAWEDHPLSD